MNVGFTIKWTNEAANNLAGISKYIEEHWTQKEIRKFFTKFEKQLEILTIFPTAYPVSQKSITVRRCVFTPELTIYYSIREKHIVLLSIFDVRQQPGKLNI